MGIGEGFLSDSRSPTPSLNQTPREGFVLEADGESGAWVPSGDKDPRWLARVSVCLVYRKFCPQMRAAVFRVPAWGFVDRGGKGLEDGTRWFRES